MTRRQQTISSRGAAAMAATPLLIALATAAGAPAPHPAIPCGPIPEGLGVNIHFTDPRPGEMRMLAEGGFRVARMDFHWQSTERQAGQYDFRAYERLLGALEAEHVRPLFILDYGNPLYDDGLSPHSDAGREAFARWAAAAVTHFRGHGILWEMWNEPNIGFWKPVPDADDYARLALAVGKAIHAAAPDECYIGPGSSGIDLAFLETCFKAGLLNEWDAVTVHPYRQSAPETAIAEYTRLRALIESHTPAGRAIPILSGEWGFSVTWHNFDEARQGKYLARQWLVNLMQDIPVSIWYDWHDDGRDPKEPEHHFGVVRNEYRGDANPVYEPKPAYHAARALTSAFAGYRFNKRLALDADDTYLLLFTKGSDVKLAVWTTARDARAVTLPASPGAFAVVNHLGEPQPDLKAGRDGLRLNIGDAPLYLEPRTPDAILRVAAAWERATKEVRVSAPGQATVVLALTNPLDRPLAVRESGGATVLGITPIPAGGGVTQRLSVAVGRYNQSPPAPIRPAWELDGGIRLEQSVPVSIDNPVHLVMLPPANRVLSFRIENPSGAPFVASLEARRLRHGAAAQTARADAVTLTRGETEKTVHLTIADTDTAAGECTIEATLSQKGQPPAPPCRRTFRAIDGFAQLAADTLPAAYRVSADGDANVASEQSLAVAAPDDGPVISAGTSLRLTYRFQPGWKFLRLHPLTEAARTVSGQPKALGLWVWGDESHNRIRMRFTDRTGQTFQPDGTPITWNGWRYFEFPIDGRHHWGGADDGLIHWPIRLDTLFLLDSRKVADNHGAVYVAGPAWCY